MYTLIAVGEKDIGDRIEFYFDSDIVSYDLYLYLSIRTGSQPQLADVFIVMENPDGEYYSFPNWFQEGIRPVFRNFMFPPNTDLKDLLILDEEDQYYGPFRSNGYYFFYAVAFKAGTDELISNIKKMKYYNGY